MTEGQKWTEESYYEHLMDVWNARANGALTSSQWMDEYDLSFKLCTMEKEQLVYNANKRLFETVSKTISTDKDTYQHIVQDMVRMAGFIHRFWIPNQARNDASIKPLFEVAMQCWDDNNKFTA